MSASERFIKTIDQLGISAYDLEINYGIKNAQAKLSQYRKGVISKISLEIISAACEANPNLDAEYILTGRRKGRIEIDMKEYGTLMTLMENLPTRNREAVSEALSKFLIEYKGKPLSEVVIMDGAEFRRSQELYKDMESVFERVAMKAVSKNQQKKNVG